MQLLNVKIPRAGLGLALWAALGALALLIGSCSSIERTAVVAPTDPSVQVALPLPSP